VHIGRADLALWRDSASWFFWCQFRHPIGATMGDKSPKAKQRDKNQKAAAKAQTKIEQASRQAPPAPAIGKNKK
jgi:hypothetical protein